MKISLQESLDILPLPATKKWPQGIWSNEALKSGSMSLIVFAPKDTDYQTPHAQDELYFVIKGSGVFELAGEPLEFVSGDVLFVPAGTRHKFVQFAPDLVLWAVFYGEQGGQKTDQRWQTD